MIIIIISIYYFCRNPGVRTIEEDLLAAYVKAGVVTPDHASDPGRKVSKHISFNKENMYSKQLHVELG